MTEYWGCININQPPSKALWHRVLGNLPWWAGLESEKWQFRLLWCSLVWRAGQDDPNTRQMGSNLHRSVECHQNRKLLRNISREYFPLPGLSKSHGKICRPQGSLLGIWCSCKIHSFQIWSLKPRVTPNSPPSQSPCPSPCGRETLSPHYNFENHPPDFVVSL